MSKKVAIIGGGILGLSLAYELSHAGFKVTVLEKNSDWGGLASGLKIEGENIEKYYHHWFRSDSAIQDLIKELGLGHKLQFLESSMGIFLDGKLHNFSGSLDLLKFRPLNIFNRLRAGLVSFYLQKSKYSAKYEDIKAIEWCRKYYGKQATEQIWEPLLKGKFGKYYENIAMSWMWARIHDRASSRTHPLAKEYLGYLDGGFQDLIDALVSRLAEYGVTLINNCDISSYTKTKAGHELTFLALPTNGKKQTFDIVVSTIPGPIFSKIFPITDQEKKKISKIKYLGATCMILELEKSITPYYWVNINDPEAPFLALVEHTNFVDSGMFGGKKIVYIAKYIDPTEKLFNQTQDELLDLYCDYLVKINADFKKDWIQKIHFFKSAFAQHVVTTSYQVPEYETSVDGLYYANFTQVYPHDRGTNYAVEQAKTLSNLIIAKHGN